LTDGLALRPALLLRLGGVDPKYTRLTKIYYILSP